MRETGGDDGQMTSKSHRGGGFHIVSSDGIWKGLREFERCSDFNILLRSPLPSLARRGHESEGLERAERLQVILQLA